MQTGLMWYDDDPRKTLDAKIEQAAARYREKYGRAPNACFVNPAQTGSTGGSEALRVVARPTIRLNYLWIGVDDSVEPRR